RIWIRCLAAVIIALGAWIAVQQAGLNDATAKNARLEQRTAQLAARDAANRVADARKARALCLRLNKTRAEIVPAWEKVLSSRPDWNVLLPGVEAAEPLGKCQ